MGTGNAVKASYPAAFDSPIKIFADEASTFRNTVLVVSLQLLRRPSELLGN